MTPKEKAIELLTWYENLTRDYTRGVSIKEFAKECALKTVQELLGNMGADRGYFFWSDVRDELIKL